MTEIDLTIQIVNYKTLNYIESLLPSVFSDLVNSRLKYEILILDNSSGENLDHIKNKYPDQSIQVSYSKTNLGFGGGHNLLSNKSNGKLTLLLNPDVYIIEKNTIARLIESMAVSKCVVIGPRLLTTKNQNKKIITNFNNIKTKLIPQMWDHGELNIAKYKTGGAKFSKRLVKGNVAWVSGASMLIKSSALHRINGFDEKFFLYKEEEDLCLRLRKNGETVVYDPSISVLHYGSVVANKNNIHFLRSRRYYKQKHGHEDIA